jgi:6-pyruvoyltetrahydropterin/6-carboxytetrahydropterin synthase
MTRATRKYEIDAGHRLMGHESKCRHVHGHRYVFEVTLSAEALDAVGRVLDFGEMKRLLGDWLDREWDHGFIAQEGDPLVDWLAANDMKHRVLPFPPSAENLAAHFLAAARGLVPAGVTVEAVVVRETPNCWAEAR